LTSLDLDFPKWTSLYLYFFSDLEDKNNTDRMAYLLTNAARLRASKEHAEHRGIPFEDHLARKQHWSRDQRDEYAFYERSERLDYFKARYYPDDCEECKRKADIKKMQDEYEREQEEKARVRKQEAEVRQKEKDREAAERRMMEAEDKPKTPPTPKKKATPVELDAWRRLQEEEKALLIQVARVRAEANKINPIKTDIASQHECKLCGVNFTASNGYPDAAKRKSHLATRKHQINAGLITADTYPRHCDTCDYDAKTKHAWEQHCEGKKHIARSVQTITIPTTQELEKEQRLGEVHLPKSEGAIVESS